VKNIKETITSSKFLDQLEKCFSFSVRQRFQENLSNFERLTEMSKVVSNWFIKYPK